MRRIIAVTTLALLCWRMGHAEAAVRPERLEVVPNFNAASVYAHFSGGERSNLRVRMEYRAGAEKQFRPGHPLSRTGKGRFAGSIFWLKPDQPLEVRVAFEELPAPGGKGGRVQVLTARTRTRSETFPAGMGKTYYVGPDGKDSAPGTRAKPLKTLRRAVALVQPGDTIRLLGGTYYESVTIDRSGRADAYITIEADTKVPRPSYYRGGGPRQGPIFPKLVGYERGRRTWQRVGERVFRTVEPQRVGTVTYQGKRVYHHASLEALQSAKPPLDQGWWQDPKQGRLYVRIDRDEPPGIDWVRMGVLPFGLRFRRCGYWIVKGLRFECFGGGAYSRGIEIDAARHIIVRNSTFEAMRTGISLRRAESRNCLLERNTVRDTGIWTWPWKACKSHDVEGAGISVRGGSGNVVRYNTIVGTFNGIIASLWGDLENEAYNRDVDVHHNDLALIGDDPLEPEGACMNVRFWQNHTDQTLMGISLAPITVGPVYVVRDRYRNYKAGAVKVSISSRGVVFLYHILGWTDRPGRNAVSVCGPWDNMHFRNCILRGTRYVVEDFHKHEIGCSFDSCCLYSPAKQFVKWSDRRYSDLKALTKLPAFGDRLLRVEPYAKPPIRTPSGLNPKLIDAGVRIPGINDDFRGKAPDIGPEEER